MTKIATSTSQGARPIAPVWSWETIDPAKSSQSGDIAKLFKNEAVKEPGAFAVGAPPADATLLAREAIQNSWDAARALAAEFEAAGEPPQRFRARFTFESQTGSEKAGLVKGLGLNELAARAAGEDRRKLGLADADCLGDIADPSVPIRLLKLVESGTTGMYGPWSGAQSRMFLAMVSIGFTVKDVGSGGSYGYGKSGLIRGSRTRTVVAYSCFRERPDDVGVTRRLLGMTYWGGHGESTGFARLGKQVGDAVAPYENAEADAVAAELGIAVRDPNSSMDLGTTFLLVDPSVAPDDLRIAVERNWWPAIEDPEVDFDVAIEDYDGHKLVPRPKKVPLLASFIRGYELALSTPDNSDPQEHRRDLGTYKPSGASGRPLGVIGLCADLGDWSYARSGVQNGDEDGAADHQSLVALVRGPRMVVEYYPYSRVTPFVRGTFVAAPEVDDLLRQTEPKAHDAWLARLDEEGIDPEAPKFAGEILKRVRSAVREFRKELKPPPPREQDIRLPVLDDLFRSVLENRGPTRPAPPPPDPRNVSISIDQSLESADKSVLLRARVGMRLTDRVPAAEAPAALILRAVFDEDGRRGAECPLTLVDSSAEFMQVADESGKGVRLVGPLTHNWASFEVISDPYSVDWTAQLIVSGDLDGEETNPA